MRNLSTPGFDLTQSHVFLDERGLSQNNQRKAGFVVPQHPVTHSYPHPHSHAHAHLNLGHHRHAPDSHLRPRVVSPFLTTEERHHEMLRRGLLPAGTPLSGQPKEDCFACSSFTPKAETAVEKVDKNLKSAEMIAAEQQHGFQITTNHEMIANQTAEQLTVKRDADGFTFETQTMDAMRVSKPAEKSSIAAPISNFEDSRFQETIAFPALKQSVPEISTDMNLYRPVRKPENIKGWNKYLFDQMTSADVEITKEHLKEIQQEVYNKLKLIHMGHKASREDTKSLLDMHDFLKAPTGSASRPDFAKISRGAEVAKIFKNGICEVLGLARR